MDRDELLDAVFQKELRTLNAHLPKQRKSIRELLSEDQPTVNTVNGERLVLRKDEIEALRAALSDTTLDNMMLPIVMLRRRDLGPGAFILLGDLPEEFAVSLVLGNFKGTLSDYRQTRKSEPIFYKPQVSELLRRFHSLVSIGFGLSE